MVSTPVNHLITKDITMKTLRIFTGTYTDPEIFRYLYHDLQKEFKPVADGNWVEPDNLHFTYKFIGDFNSALINQLKVELGSTLGEFEEEIELRGLDCFPNLDVPRVLHIGIYDKSGVLEKIYNKIESVACHHGVARERHSFSPHLTLMRIKSIKRDKFHAKLEEFKDRSFGTMSKFKVSLIESKLYPTGPLYREI